MADHYAPGGTHYRGNVVNRPPEKAALATETAIQEFILKGWMPAERFIGSDTNIVAFGSCFAAGIGRYLLKLGFSISTESEGTTYVQKVGDGMVNVFAICQQFEWAWEGRVPSVDLWRGWKAEEFGYDENIRLATKKLFDEADVFILTFGLSEIWYDEPTGEVFWRAVPKDKFNPERHKFRVATHAETVERLRRIYDLIRKHRPEAAIIFTLSPIPLAATFRLVSCISANAVSKARLRSAIDEVYEAASFTDPRFFYFPAYEVVLNGFRSPFLDDMRHLHVHVIEANMKAFERYFCKTPLTDDDLLSAIKAARDLDAVVTGTQSYELDKILSDLRAQWKAARPLAPVLDNTLIRQQRTLDRQKRLRAREERLAAREARLQAKGKLRASAQIEDDDLPD